MVFGNERRAYPPRRSRAAKQALRGVRSAVRPLVVLQVEYAKPYLNGLTALMPQ